MDDLRLVPEMAYLAGSAFVLFQFLTGVTAHLGGRRIDGWPVYGRNWIGGWARTRRGRRIALVAGVALAAATQMLVVYTLAATPLPAAARLVLLVELPVAGLWTLRLSRYPVRSAKV